MPSTAINFGRVLIIVGIIGYIYGFMGGYASPTALIPAFFGIVLMILGHLARAKDSLRKHLMHAAVIVALIGFLASAGRLLSKITEITLSAAYISQITMAAVCFLFIAVSVRSFIDARR
ncbi:MAG: hypothetical protein HKN25_12305 [Pyrinomonadaceae bacterium]|nr:hypothetical protein [Pyrinomonadaceae bacterium]